MRVPVLPLIDLMILLAWTCLIIAVGEKVVSLAMVSQRYVLFGMTPFDWVITAVACLLFALALAARLWVKGAEPLLLRTRRERNGRGFEVLPDFPDPRDASRLAEGERPPTRIAAR